MYRPVIFPEEIVEGYFGFFRSMNSRPLPSKALAYAANFYPCTSDPTAREIYEVMANVCGLAPGPFQRLHTLAPYAERIEPTRNYPNQHGSRPVSPSVARFCVQCCKEDIATRGRAYYRREHQMPGMFWCTKHEWHPLFQARAADAFLTPPDRWAMLHRAAPANNLKTYSRPQRAFLKQFAAVNETLLHMRNRIPARSIRTVLRERGRELGLDVHPRMGTPCLSEVVFSRVSMDWLSIACSRTSRPEQFDLKYLFDWLPARNIAASVNYAIAIAAMFHSELDALQALQRAAQTRPHSVPIHPSREWECWVAER